MEEKQGGSRKQDAPQARENIVVCPHCRAKQKARGSRNQECESCGKYFKVAREAAGPACPKCGARYVRELGLETGSLTESKAESVGRAIAGPLGAAVAGVLVPRGFSSLSERKHYECKKCGHTWESLT